jgi:hypothetical protein
MESVKIEGLKIKPEILAEILSRSGNHCSRGQAERMLRGERRIPAWLAQFIWAYVMTKNMEGVVQGIVQHNEVQHRRDGSIRVRAELAPWAPQMARGL